METKVTKFGQTSDGDEVMKIVLINKSNGFELSMITYGASILSMKMPDKNGENIEEITMQRTNMEDIEKKSSYYGATVGRIANRTANGKFEINGKEYSLAVNNGPHHLHGGIKGLDKRIWTADPFHETENENEENEEKVGIRFTILSPDGEEGYPGEVKIRVTYTLSISNKLDIEYHAESNKDTMLALTNHTYWNLSGSLKEKAHQHYIELPGCHHYLPSDHTLLPTGEIKSVDGNDFDLRQGVILQDVISKIDGGGKDGYDHCFVIDENYNAAMNNNNNTNKLPLKEQANLIGTIKHTNSGRCMSVYTNQPGVQFYTANWESEDIENDFPYIQHNAICLEAEAFPGSANNLSEKFPSVLLKTGEIYEQYTYHQFYFE